MTITELREKVARAIDPLAFSTEEQCDSSETMATLGTLARQSVKRSYRKADAAILAVLDGIRGIEIPTLMRKATEKPIYASIDSCAIDALKAQIEDNTHGKQNGIRNDQH